MIDYVETLGAAGLRVVLGTPTATPPRWLVDKHPDMLALDAEGNAHASILVIWGDECAYYLVGGTSHTFRNSGAMSLIMWEGIQRSSKHVPVFDFEGSMSPGIERFLRSFGARQAPYIQVRKASAVGTAAKTALDARRQAVKQVSKLRSRLGS